MPILSIPRPAINRPAKGQLDDTLAALRAGTDDCYVETVAEDSTVDKVRNKLSSSINSYRVRSGDKSAFAIREIKGGFDGAAAVGVWKQDKDFTPRAKKAAAAEVTSDVGAEA